MRETQSTIWDWRLKTFGPPTSLFRVLTRANEEMAELLRKLATGTHPPEDLTEEAADVAIILFGAAQMAMFELTGDQPGRVYFDGFDGAVCANTDLARLLESAASRLPNMAMVVFYARYTYRGLQVFAEGYGLSLDDAIDAKMGINRARQWNLDGTGHGYHVRDKAATP